jgi:hypothetical protein
VVPEVPLLKIVALESPMKDPSPKMLQIGKGIRPYYYLDASPLNPYAHAGDEVVIRARLQEDLVRTHAGPEFCWPVGSQLSRCAGCPTGASERSNSRRGQRARGVDLKSTES